MFEFVDTVVKIEDVPVDFRGLYAEDGDKFKLRSDDPGVASAVKALKGQGLALKKERLLTKTLKDQTVDLGALSDYGTTVEEIATGVAEAVTAAGAGKKGPEEIQKAVNTALEKERAKHGEALEGLQTRERQLVGSVSNLMVGSQAALAMAEAGVVKPELLMPFLKEKVSVVEEEGEFQVQVLDTDGKTPRFNSTGTGLFSISDLVAEMREDESYGPLFVSDKKGGGGAPGGGGLVRMGRKNPEDMTSHEKKVAGLEARGKK